MSLSNSNEHLFGQTRNRLNARQKDELLDRLAEINDQVKRQLLLEHGTLKLPQLKQLLEEGIEAEIVGDILPEYGEDEVQELCDALLRRAERLAKSNLETAFELFAIIVHLVEKYMPQTYDEGWTMQCIATDGFEKLNVLTDEHLSAIKVNRSQLIRICQAAMTATPGNAFRRTTGQRSFKNSVERIIFW